MRVSARIALTSIVLGLSACTDPKPDAPYCRQSVKASALKNAYDKAPAACVIRDGRYLLVVEHRLSGKYDLPAGQGNTNESSACTAHRETFEETGLNVEVVKFVGQSGTGLHFFHCQQQAGFSAPDDPPPVPFWYAHEITHIAWIDPYEISAQQWRFPDQLVEVRAAFADR